MSKIQSVASTTAAYPSDASSPAARPAVAPKPAARPPVPISSLLRDSMDPSMRQAEAQANEGPNPTEVRFYAIKTRRERELKQKPAVKQLWHALKRSPKEHRAMDKLIRSAAAFKDELRTLNRFIDDEWMLAKKCFQQGDPGGTRFHNAQIIAYSRQAESVKVKLKQVQSDQNTVVEQISSSRLVDAQESVTRALRSKPDGTKALQDRLEMLEEVKDRAAEGNELLRDNLEVPADDEDAAMHVLMQRLSETAPTMEPVAPLPEPVQNKDDEDWQPVYE